MLGDNEFVDEELAGHLGTRLAAEVADVQAAPGLGAAVRRRYARRTWALRAVVATPVAAVLALVAAVATVDGGGHPARPPVAHGTTGAPAVRDVAYVHARTIQALDGLSGYVVRTHAVSTGTGFATDGWSDAATGRRRYDTIAPSGQRRTTALISTSDPTVVIDYENHTWWSYPARVVSPPTLKPGGGGDQAPLSVESPEEIRKALDTGRLELLGTERIGDRETLHVRLTGLPAPITVELWVDATTYLPVREDVTKDGAGHGVTDYTWLPRTPENLAAFDVAPPAGFAHRDRAIEPTPTGTGVG
jgi:hypothetical protein